MNTPSALTFTVRGARPADAAHIAQLTLQLDPDLDPAAVAQRFERLLMRSTHAFFVVDDPSADASDDIAGFVAAEHRSLLQFGERVELIALVVDPRLRRSGAGSTLVAAVEAWARQRRGVQDMAVRSSLTREDSHPFYQGIGYAHHKTQNVYTRTLTP